MQDRLMRPRDVASRLGLSRSSVYRWFWEGKLRGIKLESGPVRILESSVDMQTKEADVSSNPKPLWLTNRAGTICRRVYLSDTGDNLEVED